MKAGYPKILKCSKCGSTNIVRPLNEPGVICRCADCGHEEREIKQKGTTEPIEYKYKESPFKTF
jgi:peptide subunit release factor 1 (eRF1)